MTMLIFCIVSDVKGQEPPVVQADVAETAVDATADHADHAVVSAESPPNAIVRALLANSAGCAKCDATNRDLEDVIRANPDAFVRPVSAALTIPEPTRQRLAPVMKLRIVNAMHLATLLGKPRSERILMETHRRILKSESIARQRADEAVAANAGGPELVRRALIGDDFVTLRKYALLAMAEARSDALVNNCIERIESEDYSVQLVMLQYLRSMPIRRAEIVTSLRRLGDNPNSTLRDAPALRHAIEILEGGAEDMPQSPQGDVDRNGDPRGKPVQRSDVDKPDR